MEQSDLRALDSVENRRIFQDRFKGGSGKTITGFLVSGQSTGITAQIGKVGPDQAGKVGFRVGRHVQIPLCVTFSGTERFRARSVPGVITTFVKGVTD
ncbi:MAG: hypothetical protein V7668_05570 [Cereibacter changlensis]